jgi:glyoxylase-like metal-dependent hydrolase (beta-lactamase superfamily II)
MKNDRIVRRFVNTDGIVVYKLPVEAFPNHVTNCWLVMEDKISLLDSGSGWDASNESMLKCFETIREQFNEKVTLKDVDRLILTHGHIDHFGGVNFVIQQSGANIGIHELDASVIQHFRERLIVSTKNLHVFLARSGLPRERVDKLLEMNKWSKDYFQAAKVQFTFTEGQLPDSALVSYHAPGHCPGQVCLQLGNFLFTADHVLSHTTPNQSPEMIVRYTGLGHYFESLRKIRNVPGITLAMGGHEEEMEDLQGRIDETLAFHDHRCDKVLEIANEPMTIDQISLKLFGVRKNYHILLALTETGAHVEYLYERGKMTVTNIDEVEHADNPILYYQTV